MKKAQLLFLPIKWWKTETEYGRKNKWSLSFFLTALLFLCFAISQAYFSLLPETSSVDILLTDGIAFKEDAEHLRQTEQMQEEPLDFLLWGEDKNGIVENKEGFRSAKVPVCYVDGDFTYCMIDKKTAGCLFGGVRAAGSQIRCNDRIFTVKETLENIQNLVIVPAKVPGEAAFPIPLCRLTLFIPEGKNASVTAEDFLLRQGLSGVCLENACYAAGGFFCLLLPLVLWAVLFQQYGNFFWKYRRYPILCAGNIFLLLALLVLFFLLTGSRLSFPENWIPSSWSDFSFWVHLWEKQAEQFLVSLSAEKSQMETAELQHLFAAVFFAAASVFCFPHSFLSKKNIQYFNMKIFWRLFFILIFLYWGVLLGIILRWNTAADFFAKHPGRWLLIPCYLLLIRFNGIKPKI